MGQKNKADILAWNVALASTFVVCCLLSDYKIFSCISLIAFLSYMCLVLKRRPGIYIKYMYLVFTTGALFVSLIVIEFGEFYVSETQMQGCYVGSIPLLVLLQWIFYKTLIFVDARYEKKIGMKDYTIGIHTIFKNHHKQVLKRSLNYLTVLVVILFIYMFLTVMKNPSFILGVDRGIYRMTFEFPFLYHKIYAWSKMLLIPCVLSIIYGRKALGFTGVLLYIVHAIWIGQKFGDFLSLLTVFLIIYYTKICLNDKVMKKLIPAALIAIVGLVLMSAFWFSFTSENSAITYFATRIAGQGAMWWRTYSVSKGIPHINQIINEINGFMFGKLNTSENVGASYGIYNIMYLCTPKPKADHDISILNTRYTEAGYASAYYILGVPGAVLFGIFCAAFFAVTINHFLHYLKSNKLMEAILILRIYFLGTTMYSMFTFNQYRSLFTIASILFLLFMKNKRIVLKN